MKGEDEMGRQPSEKDYHEASLYYYFAPEFGIEHRRKRKFLKREKGKSPKKKTPRFHYPTSKVARKNEKKKKGIEAEEKEKEILDFPGSAITTTHSEIFKANRRRGKGKVKEGEKDVKGKEGQSDGYVFILNHPACSYQPVRRRRKYPLGGGGGRKASEPSAIRAFLSCSIKSITGGVP